MYKVYSFKDHSVVVNYPGLGRYKLSEGGIGKITVAFAQDLASVTTALDGMTIINKEMNSMEKKVVDSFMGGEAAYEKVLARAGYFLADASELLALPGA